MRGLLIAITVFLLAACGRPAKPHVILISIDTLRSDHLSAYGYRALTTPNIDSQ